MDRSVQEWYDLYEDEARKLTHAIWEHPEFAMEEHFAASHVGEFLERQGFEVTRFDVRNPEKKTNLPNAVYAKWGHGKPIIGVLGELDSLKGLGNKNVPYYAPVEGCGHGCGHNLVAGSGVAGASALRYALEKEKLQGTVVFIGCPAEEALNGKVWLAKWGYFDDLDVAVLWHPFGRPLNFKGGRLAALTSILFEFSGRSAHSAKAWEGRSALDACELMNVGVNYLREHMTPDGCIHYVYEDGGKMPNIVPDHASVFYYIRSKDENNDELVERVKKVAQGAALMTETELKMTLRGHSYGTFRVKSLNQYVYEEAKKIPSLKYEEEDYAFARELYRNFFKKEPPEDPEALIPTKFRVIENWDTDEYAKGSTDMGDVSHIVPTIQFGGLGEMTGSPEHHWTITAAVGTAIGEKAAIYTSKIIAQSGLDIFRKPELVETFWKDFQESRERDHIPPYKKYTFEI